MKFTDKEHMKKFVELVKSAAGTKAYRVLGLGRAGIREHLQYLSEYEKVLAEPEVSKESVKVEEPKKVTKISSIRKAKADAKEKSKDANTEGVQRSFRIRDTKESSED